MRDIIRIPASEVMPSVRCILKNQGVPDERFDDPQMTDLAAEARSLYKHLCSPRALLTEISRADFDRVYCGEGHNATRQPVGEIYPGAQCLVLFAVTIGEPICTEIGRRFDRNDFAVASMLDAAASEGTDMLAEAIEARCRLNLRANGRLDASAGLMRFSPGYCGWHLSGQKQLFDHLHPADIGIELLDSFLMRPLKSISGVMIGGPKEIFEFDCDYSFCEECGTFSCRERLKLLQRQENQVGRLRS
jgi:hypothetical protein